MAGVHFDFADTHVLVTGGSNGIGLGIAHAFADAGASVTITGTQARAGDYAHDLSRFAYRSLQLASPESVAALVDATVADGRLDVLVVDLPPGTGDVTISLLELMPDAGLITVTTPQAAAHTVARRVGMMARDARMPLVGVIENMSELVCGECGAGSPLFGAGGGAQLAADLGVPLLGQIPLDMALREAGDRGVPVVAGAPSAPSARCARSPASSSGEPAS